MQIIKGKKRIFINARKVSFFGMIRGLMFRNSGCDNLLFSFSRPVKMRIHSFFVFFPFLAVWLDGKNRVIDWKIVRPFRLSIVPKKPFVKLVEVPLHKKNDKIICFFVGKGKDLNTISSKNK